MSLNGLDRRCQWKQIESTPTRKYRGKKFDLLLGVVAGGVGVLFPELLSPISRLSLLVSVSLFSFADAHFNFQVALSKHSATL